MNREGFSPGRVNHSALFSTWWTTNGPYSQTREPNVAVRSPLLLDLEKGSGGHLWLSHTHKTITSASSTYLEVACFPLYWATFILANFLHHSFPPLCSPQHCMFSMHMIHVATSSAGHPFFFVWFVHLFIWGCSACYYDLWLFYYCL